MILCVRLSWTLGNNTTRFYDLHKIIAVPYRREKIMRKMADENSHPKPLHPGHLS